MRNFLKGLIVALIAIALSSTMAPVMAATAGGNGDFSFTVVSTDYDHSEAQFSIEDSDIIKVNGGADQVSWEVENATGKISAKQIRKAPRIHTECTQANRRTQSQQIWRTTHHATIVVVLPGSCLWNRGKHDHIMMGFDWHVTSPAILVGDKHHRYRHGFSLVRNRSQVAPDEEVVGKVKLLGKTWLIVRKCKNFIGGPVDVYVPNVVQVHYANDIKKSGKAVAASRVDGTVTFNITCPNGANFNTTVHTWANGVSEAMIEFTERTRISVLDALKVQLATEAQADGEASATSSAGSSITVSGSCGNNPPVDVCPDIPGNQPEGTNCTPPTPKPHFQDISLVNFVYVGHQITLSVSGTTAQGRKADLFCRALNGGTVTSATNRQSITTSPFTKSFDYVAPGEIPGALKDGAGNVIVPAGHDMVECVITQDDGQTDTIRTAVGPDKFEIRAIPPQSE